MRIITAITAQKNNKKRANIFVDGEYYCSLEKMAVVSFGLKEGFVVDEKFSDIILDSEKKSAFDLAIKYLSLRMRTLQEIVRYLLGKSFSHNAVEATVEKLLEYGYLNDKSFSEAYIKNYKDKYGKKKLAYELSRLGVDEEIINSTLREGAQSQEDAAQKAAEKYNRTHRKSTYNKLVAFLYSRGFEMDVAKSAAAKTIEAYGEEFSDCD